jgi:hypothetical protein
MDPRIYTSLTNSLMKNNEGRNSLARLSIASKKSRQDINNSLSNTNKKKLQRSIVNKQKIFKFDANLKELTNEINNIDVRLKHIRNSNKNKNNNYNNNNTFVRILNHTNTELKQSLVMRKFKLLRNRGTLQQSRKMYMRVM